MTDDPVDLDTHRDTISQKSAEIRRRLIEVKADQNASRDRQEEFERFLLEVPAETLPEAAARIHVLMQSFAAMPEAQDPCCQKLIADALDALGKLCDHAKEH
jgi:hypothetical protein